MLKLPQLLKQYRQQHQALPAFNIDSFEIFQAVEKAVIQTNLPCIVQLSSHEDDFIQAEKLFLLVRKANAEGLPIYLNMDHGHDLARLEKLAKLGFDMLHFDGSDLDYSKNLNIATDFSHHLKTINPNIVVEVEFNKIISVGHQISPESFTKIEQALEFMQTSQADLLAVSIGNLHGVNLDQPERLDLDLLANISQHFSDQALFTLHGGSGISLDQIKQAISLGIVKININTDLRLLFKKSLKQSLANDPSLRIYNYMALPISQLQQIIQQKLIDFTHV